MIGSAFVVISKTDFWPKSGHSASDRAPVIGWISKKIKKVTTYFLSVSAGLAAKLPKMTTNRWRPFFFFSENHPTTRARNLLTFQVTKCQPMVGGAGLLSLDRKGCLGRKRLRNTDLTYHWSTAKCYGTRKQSFLYAFGVLSPNLQSDFCYHVYKLRYLHFILLIFLSIQVYFEIQSQQRLPLLRNY